MSISTFLTYFLHLFELKIFSKVNLNFAVFRGLELHFTVCAKMSSNPSLYTCILKSVCSLSSPSKA